MALSPIIEYLLAQEKSPGQPLVFNSGNQTIVPAFPPNTTTNFYLEPSEGEFAYIAYKGIWDTANVPVAFGVYIQHYGVRTFDGFLTQVLGVLGQEGWAIVTAAQKLLMRVTNRSNLNQLLIAGYLWLTVKTAEDYVLVRKAIEQYGESVRSQELHQEANRLLGQVLQAVRSVPMTPTRPPPIPPK